jgi:hypothetical protein
MKPLQAERGNNCPPPIFEYYSDACDIVPYQGERQQCLVEVAKMVAAQRITIAEIDAWVLDGCVSGLMIAAICSDQGPSAATVTGHFGVVPSRRTLPLLFPLLAVTRGWGATEELAMISRRRFHRCCAVLRLQSISSCICTTLHYPAEFQLYTGKGSRIWQVQPDKAQNRSTAKVAVTRMRNTICRSLCKSKLAVMELQFCFWKTGCSLFSSCRL